MTKNKTKQKTEIVKIDEEILHIFWTTTSISMKFSGKM